MTVRSYEIIEESVAILPTQTFFNLPEEKRRDIIDIALDEFANHPYDRASITKITRQAGIAKGSIYQYFTDKKDLYLYLVDLAFQAKMQFVQQYEEVLWDDLYEGFTTLVEQGVELQAQYPLHTRLLMQALDNPFLDESLAHAKEVGEQFYAQLISQAQKRGTVRSDVSQEILVYFIKTLITEFGEYTAEQSGMKLKELYSLETEVLLEKMQGMIGELMKLVKDGMAPSCQE